jgi:heavy metal translocating P-type ATPase
VLSRLLAVPTATYERLHPDPGTVAGETLRVGDRVRLRTGDVLPVDGIVAEGRSFVDEHSLTGEHQPVTRERGDPVYAGTALEDGTLTVEVTATGEERRLARIEQMMRTAMQRPARLATTTDRIMRWLIPSVIVLALGTFGVWFAIAGFEKALYAALSVVLITCPCALGLAIPLTLVVALGESARRGVLVRSGQTLLDLDKARTVAFDKTGTLSRVGMASVAVVVPEAVPATVSAERPPPAPDDVLRLAASVEAGVRHPLAQAVLDEADRRALDLLPVETVHTEPGAGIIGTVREGTTHHAIALGNAALAEQVAAPLPPAFAMRAAQLEADGATVLYAIIDQVPAALLALYEQIPDAAIDALHALRDDGLDVQILTGDRSAAGDRLQRRLSVPVRSGLSPSDKLDHLRRLRERGPVVMVGDGVNDAAALADADIGIGLASGADITLEAADVTLYNPDLRTVSWLRHLARRTRRVIRQNLGWTFGYNTIGLGLAVFGLLHPLVAVAVMVVSSALVTGNALRLRRMPGVRDEES